MVSVASVILHGVSAPGHALPPAPFVLVREDGPEVTSSVLLADWDVPDGANLQAVMASGVARADLDRWGFARAGGPFGQAYVPDLFVAQVRAMAEAFPDLTLRDAVGWVLVADHVLSEQMDPSCGWPTMAVVFATPWKQVGLLADGWRYVVAGLTPDEVASHEDTVRMLVALAQVRVLAGD